MIDLHTAFQDFAFDIDAKEPEIDRDFITAFLLPYFQDLPRAELEAKVAEVISREIDKLSADSRTR